MGEKVMGVSEERRRKVRRGKKRRRNGVSTAKSDSPGNLDVFTTSFDSLRFHPYLHSSVCNVKNGKKFIRPKSPNAPHNSTQFLMEDHGIIEQYHEYDSESSYSLSPNSLPDDQAHLPFHTLETAENLDYSCFSLYDNNDTSADLKTSPMDEYVYTPGPVNDEDTLNFICQEFEKEYQLNEKQVNETKKCSKENELLTETKETLIRKILMIEEKLRQLEAPSSLKLKEMTVGRQ